MWQDFNEIYKYMRSYREFLQNLNSIQNYNRITRWKNWLSEADMTILKEINKKLKNFYLILYYINILHVL